MVRTARTPAVLLHGWPVTDLHWRFLTPQLEAAGFDVISLTLPGLGALPQRAPVSYRKSDLAAWVSAELTIRGIERFVLIGHDWGAMVAALVAAHDPRAIALVVEEDLPGTADITMPAPGRDHYPTWHGPFNRTPMLAEALVPDRERAFYGTFLAQSAGPAGLDPTIVDAYIAAYSSGAILAAGLSYYRTAALDDEDFAPLTRAPIAIPVLAIGGRFAMGSAVAISARSIATNVSEFIADESGHYPAEQQPTSVASAIIRFLLGQLSGATRVSFD
jgi:pimeloyl-ACP methyl ester carboxylesterase